MLINILIIHNHASDFIFFGYLAGRLLLRHAKHKRRVTEVVDLLDLALISSLFVFYWCNCGYIYILFYDYPQSCQYG